MYVDENVASGGIEPGGKIGSTPSINLLIPSCFRMYVSHILHRSVTTVAAAGTTTTSIAIGEVSGKHAASVSEIPWRRMSPMKWRRLMVQE